MREFFKFLVFIEFLTILMSGVVHLYVHFFMKEDFSIMLYPIMMAIIFIMLIFIYFVVIPLEEWWFDE